MSISGSFYLYDSSCRLLHLLDSPSMVEQAKLPYTVRPVTAAKRRCSHCRCSIRRAEMILSLSSILTRHRESYSIVPIRWICLMSPSMPNHLRSAAHDWLWQDRNFGTCTFFVRTRLQSTLKYLHASRPPHPMLSSSPQQ